MAGNAEYCFEKVFEVSTLMCDQQSMRCQKNKLTVRSYRAATWNPDRCLSKLTAWMRRLASSFPMLRWTSYSRELHYLRESCGLRKTFSAGSGWRSPLTTGLIFVMDKVQPPTPALLLSSISLRSPSVAISTSMMPLKPFFQLWSSPSISALAPSCAILRSCSTASALPLASL
jgi:hypothetical protein